MKALDIAFAAALALALPAGLAPAADMKGMDSGAMAKADKSQSTHKAAGVVKRVDAKAGTVSLAHGPVKSLDWSAMTMTFKVADKALMDKLPLGKQVEVEFEQRGKDYVIVSAR